jgi:hypothetical protein
LRENGREGPLVKIDDPRFDPMWEAAGKLALPAFIHVADPDAFFTPIDRFNERWEELANHPNWSFYGKDFPKKEELLAARNRVIERHPKTAFVGLHVANHPENLDEPKTSTKYQRGSTGIPTCTSNSARAWESLAASRVARESFSKAIRTASCSAPMRRRTGRASHSRT